MMKNLELADWTIVDPRTLDFRSARRVAVHAEELLDRPRLVSSLDEATADCSWVVGTTSRRVAGKRRLSPEQVAREALGRRVTALVFGDERSGLSNQEMERCHDLSTIPTAAGQPSMNLAQAVAIYLWELRRAALTHASPSPEPTPAPEVDLRLVEDALRAVLRAGGFLRGPERHAVRDLMATLRRSRLRCSESRLWLAALRSLLARSPRT